jgi:hypothetical protein
MLAGAPQREQQQGRGQGQAATEGGGSRTAGACVREIAVRLVEKAPAMLLPEPAVGSAPPSQYQQQPPQQASLGGSREVRSREAQQAEREEGRSGAAVGAAGASAALALAGGPSGAAQQGKRQGLGPAAAAAAPGGAQERPAQLAMQGLHQPLPGKPAGGKPVQLKRWPDVQQGPGAVTGAIAGGRQPQPTQPHQLPPHSRQPSGPQASDRSSAVVSNGQRGPRVYAPSGPAVLAGPAGGPLQMLGEGEGVPPPAATEHKGQPSLPLKRKWEGPAGGGGAVEIVARAQASRGPPPGAAAPFAAAGKDLAGRGGGAGAGAGGRGGFGGAQQGPFKHPPPPARHRAGLSPPLKRSAGQF